MTNHICNASASYLHSNKSIWANLIVNQETDFHFSCRDTISTLLLVHFFFTWCITSLFITVPVGVFFLVWQYVRIVNQYRSERVRGEFSSYTRRDVRSIDTTRQVMRFVLYEVKLIVFYVSAAFLCKVITGGRTIRWITLMRWLIEASNLPHTIFIVVIMRYLDGRPPFLPSTDLKLDSIFTYMV
jgi:hypothetical protein